MYFRIFFVLTMARFSNTQRLTFYPNVGRVRPFRGRKAPKIPRGGTPLYKEYRPPQAKIVESIACRNFSQVNERPSIYVLCPQSLCQSDVSHDNSVINCPFNPRSIPSVHHSSKTSSEKYLHRTDSNQNRFPLDFLHSFTVILPQ